MTSPKDLLERAERHGVRFELTAAGRLGVDGPGPELERLIPELRAQRDELLELVRGRYEAGRLTLAIDLGTGLVFEQRHEPGGMRYLAREGLTVAGDLPGVRALLWRASDLGVVLQPCGGNELLVSGPASVVEEIAPALVGRLERMEPDVRAVVVGVVHRLERGRAAYGDLEVTTDRRCFRRELWESVRRELTTRGRDAVATLAEVAADESHPGSARVAAAKSILDQLCQLMADDLTERVEHLEQLLVSEESEGR